MIGLKWILTIEEEDYKEEVIFMWVYLEKVSFYMYSWEEFSFITSIVGFFVKFYLEIIVCINFDEVKKFVRVDVIKVLFKEIIFIKEGK